MKRFEQFVVESLPEIKTVYGPARSMSSRLTSINNAVSGKKFGIYHQQIPLRKLFDICKENGFEAVQEDGTPWSGFLTGRDGRASIELKDLAGGKKSKYLHVQWHKMDVSGKYEITAYAN